MPDRAGTGLGLAGQAGPEAQEEQGRGGAHAAQCSPSSGTTEEDHPAWAHPERFRQLWSSRTSSG